MNPPPLDPSPPPGPPDAGERIKHLEFIQSIIARLAANGFIIKGWTVTLTTGLIGVSADKDKAVCAAAAIIPAIVFWGMDAYYLRQERLYRKLYDDTRRPAEQQTQPVEPFSLSVLTYRNAVPSWGETMVSLSLLALHGIVLMVAILATAYLAR
jgi:hypothetical protein